MRGIIQDTVNELVDRKILIFFGALLLVGILLHLGAASAEITIANGPDDATESFSPLGDASERLLMIFSTFMNLLVFASIVSTAGLLPRMFIKGRSDFYLSKPISRVQMLVSKAFSIWLVYGLLIIITALVPYGMIGIIKGALHSGVVMILIGHLLSLLLWLTVTITAGLLFKSAPGAIFTVVGMWFLQWSILDRDGAVMLFVKELASPTVYGILEGVYYVMPKTSEMLDIFDNLGRNMPVDYWLPLWSTMLFAAVIFVAGIGIFRKREF